MKAIKSFFAISTLVMAFASCSDVPAPYTIPGTGGEQQAIKAEGDGSLETPFNSVAANNAASELASGAESSEKYYIKGKIVSIKENYTTQYGNATFYISDDGTKNGQFYVYHALYLGNKKYTAGDVLKVGDEVVVYGTLTNYGGTPETQKDKAFLYSLNGVTEGGADDSGADDTETIGTLENPLTVAEALAKVNELADGAQSDHDAIVKGKISKIATDAAGFATYKNINYYISDDGKTTTQIQVYKGMGLDNKAFSAVTDIKVGDEVIVRGKLVKYVNKSGTVVPEIMEGYLLKHTQGEATPSDDTPAVTPSNLTAGKYFMAYKNGDSYLVAKPITDTSKGYGYIYMDEATVDATGKLVADAANLFTFTEVEGGFSIQDAKGTYYYTDTSHKSFQLSATAPAGFFWSVNIADGLATIQSSVKTDYHIVYTLYNNKTHELIPSNTGELIVLVKEDGSFM